MDRTLLLYLPESMSKMDLGMCSSVILSLSFSWNQPLFTSEGDVYGLMFTSFEPHSRLEHCLSSRVGIQCRRHHSIIRRSIKRYCTSTRTISATFPDSEFGNTPHQVTWIHGVILTLRVYPRRLTANSPRDDNTRLAPYCCAHY